jgi:hypothetical protein
VLRFTEIRSPDQTFANLTFHFVGTGGSGIAAIANGLAVQANGDIVVAGNQVTLSQSGSSEVNGLARFTSSGLLAPFFGMGGIVVNSVPGEQLNLVAIQQPNGNIITVGLEDNETALAISRYLAQSQRRKESRPCAVSVARTTGAGMHSGHRRRHRDGPIGPLSSAHSTKAILSPI